MVITRYRELTGPASEGRRSVCRAPANTCGVRVDEHAGNGAEKTHDVRDIERFNHVMSNFQAGSNDDLNKQSQ
jgi:hypothetical protein